ncbi:MAG: TetR/AcrR family transcriptional regulator [Cruoricaptor ignavus]|nr:TetR/AcrR family transcriptional regulator [Cruoricaptor ignavus]
MMKYTEKQSQIIEIAKQLFAQKGYVETSMRDLAFQLDIKAASIYSHFKGKEELLQIICNEIHELMIENMETIKGMKTDIEERFLCYIKLHVETIIANRDSFEVYNKYWNSLDQNILGKYGLTNYEYFEFSKELIKEMFPNDKDLDCYIPGATTIFMIDTLNNIPKLINPKKPNVDEVVKDLQLRLIYGFKKNIY